MTKQPNLMNPKPSPEAVAAEPYVFTLLRDANVARQAAWCPEQQPDLSFRGNEIAGEVGEVCNVIKKLERERQGWRGSRDTKEHLAEELADVVICADLIGVAAGIDLQTAITAKFNATSEKVGLPHRINTALADLQRENAELKRENENTWTAHSQMFNECVEVKSDLRRYQQRLTKAEADTRRLDWLGSTAVIKSDGENLELVWPHGEHNLDVRKAIDAASGSPSAPAQEERPILGTEEEFNREILPELDRVREIASQQPPKESKP